METESTSQVLAVRPWFYPTNRQLYIHSKDKTGVFPGLSFGFLGGMILNRKGFTLVELLVVVVIIGILAAISLANFVAATKKAKNAAIYSNMRSIQIASEAYSTDSGGTYAVNASGSFLNYLPGGSNTKTGAAGIVPLNPLTGLASTISDASLNTSTKILALRAATPAVASASAGNLSYSQADSGNSYGITGADVDGIYVPAAGGKTLVLSNQ